MSGIFNNHFYHKTTRRMVAAFGSMFSDIQFVRYNKAGDTELERLTVPIVYGTKESYILRIEQDPELTRSIQVQLPRLSFSLLGMTYDVTRKQNQLLNDFSHDRKRKAYKEVPYDFTFGLSLYVRNIEDGLEIIEQILPIFNPDYTLTLNLIDELEISKDVVVLLNSIDYKVVSEGPGADGDTRLIVWDLVFVMKGFLFQPVSSAAIIKKANTYIFDSTKQKAPITALLLGGDNVLGSFKVGEYVYQGDSFDSASAKGKVVELDNVNRKLYLSDAGMDIFRPNTLITGTESGSTRNVLSYYVTSTAVVQSYIHPNPITANANDQYTITIQLSEWPFINSSS